MVTAVPAAPATGLRLVILGAIPKVRALLVTPETVTKTGTLLNADRVLGTTATMLVSLQLVTVAEVELILTEFAPWVAPKPFPLIVTKVPAGPEVGLREEMFGGFGAK